MQHAHQTAAQIGQSAPVIIQFAVMAPIQAQRLLVTAQRSKILPQPDQRVAKPLMGARIGRILVQRRPKPVCRRLGEIVFQGQPFTAPDVVRKRAEILEN